MAVFFTCIILIGSGITVFAFIWMLVEKHKLHDYRKDIKGKKEDLIKVIEDADVLISEMNRYSDYIVTCIEEKHSSLAQSLSDADLRIESLKSAGGAGTPKKEILLYDEEPAAKILEEEKPENMHKKTPAHKGKILPFDLKKREIINLSKGGLDSTEIARKLNCGKGEIELIARVGRQN